MWKKLTIFTLTINLLLTAAGCVTAADKKKAQKEESFDTYEMLNLFGEVMERAKAEPSASEAIHL